MARVGDNSQQIWTVLPPHTFAGRPEELYKIQIDKPSSLPAKSPSPPPSPRPWRCRRASVLSLLVTVLAAVALAIGIILYLTVGETTWEEEEADMLTAETEDSQAVEGRFRITNWPYTADLRDKTSRAYVRLSAQVLQSLDQLFLQSYLVRDYNTTKIISFSELSEEEGVVTDVQVIFNRPFSELAQQVGLILIRELERNHGHLPTGTLHLDVRSLAFVALNNPVEITPQPSSFPDAGWSPWSEWTSCLGPVTRLCDPYRVQSRSRTCRSAWGQGYRLPSIEPCMATEGGSGGRDFEIQECICHSALPTTTSTSTITFPGVRTTTLNPLLRDDLMLGDGVPIHHDDRDRPCNQCFGEEICLVSVGAIEGRCVWPKIPLDPTKETRSCGGWCSAPHEVCRHLGNITYQCLDDSECLPEEWRCGNGLCIPRARRCDGHFNCYDMTDEYGCECSEGFHCGNKTSCLPLDQRCNGFVECWDGADELNCTKACLQESQFTCNSGQCVDKEKFCDGFADCEDNSDEPKGCDAPCLGSSQWQCSNRRCIPRALWCDGSDDCGDGSDEARCSSTTTTSVLYSVPTVDADKYT